MKSRVSYCKETDDYEIDDYYGGTVVDVSTIKKLLKIVKETHPELLEKIK